MTSRKLEQEIRVGNVEATIWAHGTPEGTR